MKCPNCDVALAITDRQGIEIDYCPQCRGVWLDRGELDKLIERSAASVSPPPQGSQQRDRDRDRDDDDDWKKKGHPKKKKAASLLGEIFDFG